MTTFWIFRPQAQGFQLLLKASVHTINIKEARTRGYLDIEGLLATAVTYTTATFKFDGSKYVVSKSKTSPIQ